MTLQQLIKVKYYLENELWKKQQEIEERLNAMASPFRTAEATGGAGNNHGIDIIDPRDTRPLLCDFVEMAQEMIETQIGPAPVPYTP